jgi:hypothetical protein
VGNEPQILPPGKDLGPVLPPSQWKKYKPLVVVSSFSLAGFGFAAWMFSQFLQARGFTSVVGSRVFLALACLGVAVAAFAWTRLLRRRNTWFVVSLIALALVAILFDWLIPMPQTSQIFSRATHERPSDWRTIRDWQKAELAPVLEQYPNNTLHIVASSLSDETWDYANQFKEFFKAHKWKVIGPETAPADQVALNIQLSTSEQYWGKQRPEAFTALDTSMRFIGIKMRSTFVLDPLVAPDELVMWIGADAPPGYPEHVPLQLGTICQHPLQFTDDTMHFFGDQTDFVRWVKIRPSSGAHFVTGQKILVLLTGPARKIATSEFYQVQALGKLMPRPDALDVSIAKDLKVGEQLEMKIVSDKELRVKCVEDRAAK